MTESHDNTTCRRATTTDPTVQAVAEALDKNFNPDRYPVMAAMFMDYAVAAVAAARPLIAAEALAENTVRAIAADLARTTALSGGDAALIVDAALALADEGMRKAKAEALREAADALPAATEGPNREGTAKWPHCRDAYSLAIDEAAHVLRARADDLEAGR